MTYKLVLFDFDGTLADSFSWSLETINKVADKYGFKRIEQHELDTLRSWSGRQIMAHLGLPLWKLPLVTAEMRSRMAASAAEIPLFEGVDRLLARLDGHGIHTAVVTTNARENVLRILGHCNASRVRYFECGASMFGKAARFRKTLRHAGLAPHEALCIGDEIRDARAAAAAGLDFAGVAWGYTHPEALAAHSTRALFRNMDEIADALCRPVSMERRTL